jgi:hypothetical protein
MFARMQVQKALRLCCNLNNDKGLKVRKTTSYHDTFISMLIHDIFGGEILKTPEKGRWHFYNRIEGERIDFTASETVKGPEEDRFKDIPSTPDETCSYFAQEDYSDFFIRFIRVFEEAVGLGNYRYEYSMK